MITHATFQNFKSLRSVEVSFDSRLTVLVGPNGSGKTSVLQGIDVICRTVATRHSDRGFPSQFTPGIGNAFTGIPLQQIGISDFAQLTEYVSKGKDIGDLVIGCQATDGKGTTYGAQIKGNPSHQNQDQLHATVFSLTSKVQTWEVDNAPENVRNQFGESVFLRLDPIHISTPSDVLSKPPRMQETGAGLPSTLAYIALSQPEKFATITTALKTVIPNLVRIRFDKEQSQRGYGDVVVLDFVGANGINATHASSGTLYVLGLLTSLLSFDPPKTVLLDDLDHGLHPKAQKELVEVMRNLLAANKDLQIIATAHSPYILDRLEPNEVRVTTIDDFGNPLIARLEEHPDFERWNKTMTPGEIWSHLGEKWVRDVKTKSESNPIAS